MPTKTTTLVWSHPYNIGFMLHNTVHILPCLLCFARYYGLVPIAAEDYSGYDTATYFAVAISRRTESYMTLFNLKGMLSFLFMFPKLGTNITDDFYVKN